MKISQTKNGKWLIDFTCKGRRVQRVIGYSKREAEAALATARADIIRDRYNLARTRKEILFETFAKEFLELYSKQNKKSWERDEFSLNHLKNFFKDKTLSDITPDMIEKYKVKRKAEVSPSTVNKELACLKTLFSKAVEWGKIETSPAKRVKKFKESNVKERILSSDEARRLIESASPHLKPILILLLNTGMRRNEALSLRWENINFSKGFIFIEDSKSGKSRTVPMNLSVLEALKEIKRSSEFVFSFPGKKNIKDIRTSFKSTCEKANIEGITLHSLRHTAASKMVEAGVDLVTVSKILGHASIQMTMRYAHPTPENMKLAVEKLSEAFGKSREKVVSLEIKPLVSYSKFNN